MKNILKHLNKYSFPIYFTLSFSKLTNSILFHEDIIPIIPIQIHTNIPMVNPKNALKHIILPPPMHFEHHGQWWSCSPTHTSHHWQWLMLYTPSGLIRRHFLQMLSIISWCASFSMYFSSCTAGSRESIPGFQSTVNRNEPFCKTEATR